MTHLGELDPNLFEVVEVPDRLVGLMIGKRGSGIRKVQVETGATVTVGKLAHDDLRKVCLAGSEEARIQAKEWIASFVATNEHLPDIVTDIMEVPDLFARDIIGPKGATIQAVRDKTGVFALMGKVVESGEDARKLTLRGNVDAVAKAREQVERILLELHRAKGCFNAPLEEKFKGKDLGSSLTILQGRDLGYSLTSTPLDIFQAVPQLSEGDAGAGGAAQAHAAGSRRPQALRQQHAEGLQAWGAPGGAPRSCGSILPMSHEDILKWASHYANDAASVALYLRLKRAGVPLGAAAATTGAFPAPGASFE